MFHIDEDAYQLLDKYLSNLRIHFREEEGSDEIMDDFEARISELLGERVRLGYEVITIEQVEEIIKRMGKPEEIFEGEGEAPRPEESGEARQQARGPRKRLMRDPDNRVLGGVAGGIAAYMGWDPTAVRIVFILLLFFYGIMIPLYFLLWIIVPLARTATEKLEMRGESVTIENIGKTVTDGFEKVSDRVNDYISSDKPRTTLQRLGDAFVQIIGFLLKCVIILAGIILLPPLALVVFVLIIVTFALMAGGAGVLYELSPFGMDLIQGMPTSTAIARVRRHHPLHRHTGLRPHLRHLRPAIQGASPARPSALGIAGVVARIGRALRGLRDTFRRSLQLGMGQPLLSRNALLLAALRHATHGISNKKRPVCHRRAFFFLNKVETLSL